MLHGQNKKTDVPPLALFCICTPFGPPSLLDIPQKEVMFKSKHKLDFAFVSMDQRFGDLTHCLWAHYFIYSLHFRGKDMLSYEDDEITDVGGYDLVHYDDLSYVASAHQERKCCFCLYVYI